MPVLLVYARQRTRENNVHATADMFLWIQKRYYTLVWFR